MAKHLPKIYWTYLAAHSPVVTQAQRKRLTIREDYVFLRPSDAIRASREELEARQAVAKQEGVRDFAGFAPVPLRILGENPGEDAVSLFRETSRGRHYFDTAMVNVEYWPEGT